MAKQLSGGIRALGVLTGGGDVPGLNAAIEALVYRAETLGIRVVGLRLGWAGITFLDRSRTVEEQIFDPLNSLTWETNFVRPLTRLNTRGIERQGGTILQSSRTNPAKVKVSELPAHLRQFGEGHDLEERVDLTSEVLKNIEFLGLDGLVVIGGDDTLSYGAVLDKQGIPVWGIPKTMDNDVPGTDYCIGFQTAVERATEFINRVRSTAESHSQTIIYRLFGRDAGFTALETAKVTWADRVVIPEFAVDINRLAELIAQDRKNPQHYSSVLISEGGNLGIPVPEEGPADAYGHRKKVNIAEFLAGELQPHFPGVRLLTIDLTYILRAGEPVVYDKQFAITCANLIMSAVEKNEHGVMAAARHGTYIYTDMPGKNYPARRVNVAEYHPARYRPYYENLSGKYEPQP